MPRYMHTPTWPMMQGAKAETVTLKITLDSKVAAMLANLAKTNNMSLSEMLRTSIIQQFIETQDEEECQNTTS